MAQKSAGNKRGVSRTKARPQPQQDALEHDDRQDAGTTKPQSFREFVDRVDSRYRWYRHCEVLASVLQRVADGHLKRLMVFEPPRHGKSQAVSRLFSAYYLSRFPQRWVGLTSYGADLAYTLSRSARDHYQNSGGSLREGAGSVKHWETGAGGGMWACGVGGPITGKGWHLGIIDDPIKNAAEAASETIRAKHKDWYESTFYTREEPTAEGDPDGAVIVIQTRWHEDDLAGWLLAQEDGDDEPERWHIVCFEAIKDEAPQQFPNSCTVEPDWRASGEALCPERRPREKLERIARRIGSYFWAALFQQQPQPAAGNKFKREWFRRWRSETVLCPRCQGQGMSGRQPCSHCIASGRVIRYHLERKDAPPKLVNAAECRRFGTVDLAVSLRTSADYTVLAAWAVTLESELILLDLVRDRFEEPDILKEARAFSTRHGLGYLTVESNGMQLGIVQSLRRGSKDDQGRARGDALAVRGLSSSTDKISRASTAIVACEAGQLYLPQAAPWVGEYEKELLAFPNASHDDQVDVTSLAANDVFKRGGSGGETDAFDDDYEREIEAEHRRADNPLWWS